MGRRVYSFGPFELDLDEHILSRDGHAMALKPKVFDVLAVLVENSGKVMCKDELLERVWADRFVEEGNLAVSIFEIRKALGSDNGGQHYVETVPRRGYRFAATVVQITNLNGPEEIRFDSRVAESTTSQTALEEAAGSIAVLPFKSIGTSTNEYLALGIADALITKLSNLKHITVRPTSSVRKYADIQDPIEAGKEQRVEWVLDGSVQLSEKRIRLTVQLVRVRDEGLRWAEKFDESFTDIFAVEDSISERVSKSLAPKLTGEERLALGKRYTLFPEAYQAYLRGRFFLEKRATDSCHRAIEYFTNALEIDPRYALAYAGLAECYIVLGSITFKSREAYVSAESAIRRALDLDDLLPEAHATFGHLKTRRWDLPGAEKEFKRSIELNGNYPKAHMWYAFYLCEIGQFDKAFQEIQRARDIDPVSPIIESADGSLLYLSRQYDQAIERLRRALELDGNFALAHSFLGFAYEAKGLYDEASAEYRRAADVLGDLPEFVSCLGRVHALAGRTDKANQAIAKLKSMSAAEPVQPTLIALIYAALDKKNDALQWLERAYSERDPDLVLLRVDPRLDCLRADPRFTDLVERVGLGV
jgi:DNA-binding winged helix-turn-helix (wHTH) protein/tetratricopeptide (TPR) repeat protein